MAFEAEIVREFITESREGLDQLDRDLLALEKGDSDAELINRIFRNIHTVKGTSGFFEFSKLEALAHSGESLLDSIRSSRVLASAAITSALLQLVDGLRTLLNSIETTGSEGSADFSSLIERIRGLDAPAPSDTSEDEIQAMPQPTPIVESSEQVAEPATSASAAESADAAGKAGAVDSTLRVDVAVLDQLMNLVGELVLTRNQLVQFIKQHTDPSLIQASQRLNLITSELQEGVMKTRMQPISNVWSRFPRVVRDLAKQLQKQVRLDMDGKETELDKTIIEAIKDPLTHIIRNSVDHGIELPAARAARGKPGEGRIQLKAYHEGGYVIIEVIDDGAGLNTDRIRQKALERGLVTSDKLARMSEQEVHRLIFMPGFSTAEAVTNISGRGVGMDVVRSSIERIGGQVDISSRSGCGSSIRIKIPLTLAIVPALIVSSGGSRFAVPQVVLVELVRVDPDDSALVIESLGGTHFCRLRGDLLPLVNLNAALGLAGSESPLDTAKPTTIVVVKAEATTFGVIVDEVLDTEEIVVKPLGKQLKNIRVLAGATVMGDGQVALILDVLGLGKHARVLGEEKSSEELMGAASEGRSGDRAAERHGLLIVHAAADHRMALPLEFVHRLEEIPRDTVEPVGGKSVVQYRGGILPLVDLASYFTGGSCLEDELLHVVVYSHEDADTGRNHQVGFVVREIVDIVETELDLQAQHQRRGTLGAAIIQERITELLDPTQLIA